MNNTKKHKLEDLLSHFDNTISDNPLLIRCAVTPLYEYYNKLLFEIGKNFCEFDEKLLIKYGLKTRWSFISFKLQKIEDCSYGRKIITKLDFERNEVGHNDKHIPNINDLKKIRKKSSDFKKWVIDIGKKYQEKNKNFTFKEKFYDDYFFTIKDGDSLIREFENNPYISFEYENLWNELRNTVRKLYSPIIKFNKLEDIKKSDLDNLLFMTKLIWRFKGREDMILHLNRCPKCGGKIIETSREFGGTIDDPEPDGFHYRVGCEKCDYYIDKGTESL